MILEDLVLISTLRMISSENGESSQVFDIHVCDGMTGESGKATWNKDQWRAVMMLLADDDDELGVVMRKGLYDIAEPAIAMLPDICRPIP